MVPDLDLIKQEKQVCGRIDRIERVICTGRRRVQRSVDLRWTPTVRQPEPLFKV